MAIAQGVRVHRAWLAVDGENYPIQTGTVSVAATRASSTFSAQIPMFANDALNALAAMGENNTRVMVQSGSGALPLITGEIDTVSFDFDSTTISVSGRCKSAKLHQQKTSDKWVNQTPDKIIQDLAGKAGLSVQIDSETLKAGRYWNIDWTKLTDGVSMSAAIHKLADFMGARWWVDASGTLHVKAKSEGSTYTITYVEPTPSSYAVSDALRISVSRNVQAAKTTEVTVKSWNQKEKRLYQSKKTTPGVGGTQTYLYHIPGLTQEHADRHAKNRSHEATRHELTVRVDCVGDPSIDPSMKLQLNGTPFAQAFDIDSISHSIGMGGHRMSISARSAKSGRSAS